MKKVVLFFLVSFLAIPLFAQTLQDYVTEVRGDTLVVADYWDKDQEASTINNCIDLDAAPPAGRVYMLKANGYYPLQNNVTTPTDRPLELYGDMDDRLVVADDAGAAPPVICGNVSEGGTNTGGINFQHDLTVKNISIIPAAADGSLGWAFFGAASPDRSLVLENDIFEHTRWVMIQSNDEAGTSIFIKDCYFVNLSGQPCRRNGGAYDNVNNNTDTMYVENTTHVMAQGMMYKFRNYQVNRIFINHNTFVNCSGNVLETLGYQSNMIVTNNIFVNSNVQPYFPGYDVGETDAGNLPMGIINVAPLLPEMPVVDRKILVEGNVLYFDPILDDMVATVNADAVNGRTDWVSQMMKMNSRTAEMFADDATYPYLTEGVWYEKMPNFTNPEDLFTDQLDAFKAFTISTVDSTSEDVLAPWRLVYTDLEENYVYSDWPIPVDLSYDDADLMAGATGGFPVGDLNWFPAKKAEWKAQMAAEHAALENALQNGTLTLGVEELGGVPTEFSLNQNYPNPFNPTTTINFSIPKAGNVTLKVYNALGQEVATLVNGFMAAQSYNVDFDASQLASGVYVYTLNYADFAQSKKMVLMK